MNSKGFTLVEILITMFILVAIMALTIPIYTKNVDGISAVSASEDSKIDNLLAMETIRLDLQHVGTGIGLNEATLPIVYNETVPALPILDLRSTLVNTNQSTLGWGLINCTVGSAITTATDYIVDQREDATNTNLVLLDSDKNYISNTNGANYNCPTAAEAGQPVGTSVLYTAFPTAFTAAAPTNYCTTGFCSRIRYNFSAAQPLETCAVGTRNLLRAVGGAAGDTLVNCVAGFRVRFDIDADNNDSISAGETGNTNLPAAAGDIMAQVKNIDMYLLVQVGKEDISLRSNPTLTVDGIIDFTLDWQGITNRTNYRWKIFKVSGKPNGWL